MDNKDQKVEAYIAKQKSPQKEVCQQLRALIHKTLPEVDEEMKWGVPAFGGGKFYVVALKDHVNLGFSSTGLSDAELQLFDGVAKTMARLEISRTEDIDQNRITKLLNLVNSKPKV